MSILFYLIPSLGALIGTLTVFLTYYCLWHRLSKNKDKIVESLNQKFESSEMKDEFNKILDERLDGFIDDLRMQIPMGAMLLTDALSGKVKGLAKEGMIKMMPDIKERLLNHLLDKGYMEKILLRTLRPELYLIVLYGTLLGFILGMIWIFLD